MPGELYKGTDGRCSIGGVVGNLTKWSLNIQAADLDRRSFESQGYDEGETGFLSNEVTIEGWVDKTDPAYDSASMNLRAGALLTDILCYVSQTDNKFFNLPEVRILGTPYTLDMGDRATFSVTGKTNGQWFYPT